MAGKRKQFPAKPFSGCHKAIMRYHRGQKMHKKVAALLLFMILLTIMGFTSLVPASAPSTSVSGFNKIHGHTQHLTIMSNGDLEVREVIEVDYLTPNAHSGILRLMPQKHNILEVNYKSAQDERPGLILPTFSLSGNTLRIGDPNTFLEPGRHWYQVAYIAPGQVEKQNGLAKLEWSVTGSKRFLPISVIHFRAALPPSVDTSKARLSLLVKSNSDPEERPFESYSKEVNTEGLYFRTTRALKFNESLAIRLSWEET